MQQADGSLQQQQEPPCGPADGASMREPPRCPSFQRVPVEEVCVSGGVFWSVWGGEREQWGGGRRITFCAVF